MKNAQQKKFKHISRLQREFNKEGDVDDDYLQKFSIETTSWRAMLIYQFDVCYIAIMMLQIYISNTLVLIDALFYELANNDIRKRINIENLSIYIYILDYMYLVDVLMKAAFNKFGSKNQKLQYTSEPFEILIFDILSVIPYEILYANIVRFPNRKLMVFTRLRTLLRLLRLYKNLLTANKYQMNKSLVLYRAILFIMEIARGLMILHYFVYCRNPTGEKCKFRDWNKLLAMFHINLNSIISSGVFLEIYKINYLNQLRSFFSIVYNLFVAYVVSVLTCMIMEEKENIYMYVNEYSQICSTFKYLKQKYKHMWTYEDQSVYLVLKNYYSYLLKKRNGYLLDISTIRLLPRSQMNSIFAEVAYNALKHSHVFRHQDIHLLRYLSTLMRFDFAVPGQIILRKGELNSSMIYITHGVLQILSQEDNETSVLSISGGSCFGECTLFFQYPCSCTIVCQTYCELVVLPLSNFRNMIKIYPCHYKYLRGCVLKWINQAVIIERIRGDKFSKNMILAKIKIFQNAIWENSQDQMMEMYEASLEDLSLYIVHLDKIVVSDDIELIEDKVFIKTSFHFILQPNSPLLLFWDMIILAATFAYVIIYPIFCTFTVTVDLYQYFFIISVTFLYAMDVYFQLFTAVKTRGATFITFRQIAIHRMCQVTFILDCLSCLPIEIITIFIEGHIQSSIYPFLQANRLFKYYRIETFFKMIYTRSTGQMNVVEICRYCFHLCMFYYYTCIAVYRLNCIGYDCNQSYAKYLNRSESKIWYSIFLSTFSVTQNTLSNTHYDEMPMIGDSFNYLLYTVLAFMIVIIKLLFMTNVIVTSALKKLNVLKDQEKIINIFKSMQHVDLGYDERIYKYLKFRWNLQHFTTMQGMDIPLHVDLMVTFRNIHYSKLFDRNAVFSNFPEDCRKKFYSYIKRKILPSDQWVCRAGEVVTEFYIIEKGMCQLRYVNGFTTLRECDNIAIIEALMDAPIQFDVVTVSDCILLCIDKSNFVQFLLFYPSIKGMLHKSLDGVTIVNPNENSHISRLILNEKVYKYAAYPIKRNLGIHAIETIIAKTMIIVQKSEHQRTFRLESNFIFYWELFRCIAAYLNCLISLTNYFISNGNNFYIFTIFNVLDTVNIVDIIIRMMTSYYNKIGIEITNYKCTMKHYLTHSFVVDLLGSLPFDLIISGQVVYTRMNRVLHMYRLLGYAKFQENKIQKIGFLLYFVIFLLFVLCIVCFASITIYYECQYSFDKKYLIPRHKAFEEGVICKGWFSTSKYLNVLGLTHTYYDSLLLITSAFFNMGLNKYFVKEWYLKAALSTWSLFGLITLTTITGKVISFTLFKNDQITEFQHGMKQLVKYLSYRPIDKNVKNEVINYFEYTWDKRMGVTMMHVISDFPLSLKLNILYRLFGPSMESRSIFSRASKSFIKQILLISDQETYLKTGIIYKVNDIHNKIFYLWKGLVEVVGPDLNKLQTLYPGSLFGCLDKCSNTRQTLTMVANGHVEILVFRSDDFYKVLSNFSEFQKIYERYIAIYTDFIPSIKKRQMDNEDTHHNEVETKKYRYFKVHKPTNTLYYCELALFINDFIIATPYEVVMMAIGVSNYDYFVFYLRDLLWLIRIYMKFHIAFENEYGMLIFDKKQICKRYMNMNIGFYFDICANFPLDVFTHLMFQSDYKKLLFNVFRLNRFLRVFYLLHYINTLSKKLNVNSFVVRLIDIIIQVVVLLEFQSALLYFIEENFFISKDRNQNLLKLIGDIDVTSRIFTMNTINSLFHNNSALYIFFCILLDAIFMIWLLSRFLSTMQIVMQIKSDFIKMVSKFVGLLRVLDISTPEMNYINTYLNSYNRMLNYPTLLDNAPYYLQEAVLYSMFGYHLHKHSIWKKCHSDFLRQLAATMRSETYYGNYILTIGDTDGRMYFIEEGTIHALSKDTLYIETIEHILGSGDHFGYKQLIYPNIGHDYTYKAESISVLVSIRRKDFLRLLEFFPATKKLIYEDNDYKCFL